MHRTSKKQQVVQQARWALCGGLSLLVLLQAVGLLLIESRRPDLADPEFGLRWQSFACRAIDDQSRSVLAVIGSSRFAHGVNTDVLSRPLAEGGLSIPASNLSISGGTSVWQHLVLRRLSHYGPLPRRVLLELFPTSILGGDESFYSGSYIFPPHRQRHCDLAVLDELMPEQSRRHRSTWWWNNGLIPFRTHGTSLSNGLLPLFKTDDPFLDTPLWRRRLSPTGYTPWEVAEPTPTQRENGWAVTEQQYAQLLGGGMVAPRSVGLYRQTLTWCQEHGIEVAGLVMMPESPRYRALYSEANWLATCTTAAMLSRDFSVPLIDARAWVTNEESFFDGHHLLPEPAREFTLRLGELVLPGGQSLAPENSIQAASDATRRRVR